MQLSRWFFVWAIAKRDPADLLYQQTCVFLVLNKVLLSVNTVDSFNLKGSIAPDGTPISEKAIFTSFTKFQTKQFLNANLHLRNIDLFISNLRLKRKQIITLIRKTFNELQQFMG